VDEDGPKPTDFRQIFQGESLVNGLDVFAFIVMGVIAGSIIVAAIFLGAWPGKIAERRNHHQAEAIKVCGWLGILTLGILWPLALIWAYTNPMRATPAEASDHPLHQTISEMKQRIVKLETDLVESRRGNGVAQS
jgi:Protein of unknown function (DUF3302)